MKTNKKLISLLILFLIIVGCSRDDNKSEIIRPVKTENARIKSSLEVYDFPGTVKANKDSKLAFRVSGTIAALYFDEGEFVEEGEIIAKIDDRDYQLQVTATQAKFAEISAEVERIIELYSRNSVSRSDYDKAIAGKTMAEAKYQSALNQLEDTKLVAPFSGYIHNIYFDIHETISKGLPAVSLIDISNLKVEAEIPSKVYLHVDNFSSFYCYPEENPTIKMPLEFKGIRKKANLNELYKIIFILNNNPQFKLAPGMIVDVKISVDNKSNQKLTIPVNSVFNKDGQSLVWILDSNDCVTARKIELGDIFSDGSIEIIEGLTKDDLIISAGIHTLEEGQKVKIINEDSPDNVGGLL